MLHVALSARAVAVVNGKNLQTALTCRTSVANHFDFYFLRGSTEGYPLL